MSQSPSYLPGTANHGQRLLVSQVAIFKTITNCWACASMIVPSCSQKLDPLWWLVVKIACYFKTRSRNIRYVDFLFKQFWFTHRCCLFKFSNHFFYLKLTSFPPSNEFFSLLYQIVGGCFRFLRALEYLFKRKGLDFSCFSFHLEFFAFTCFIDLRFTFYRRFFYGIYVCVFLESKYVALVSASLSSPVRRQSCSHCYWHFHPSEFNIFHST